MTDDELPVDFNFDDVKSILEKYYGNQIDPRIVSEVFERAKKRAGFLKRGKSSAEGYSVNRYSVTVTDLLFWYQILTGNPSFCSR